MPQERKFNCTGEPEVEVEVSVLQVMEQIVEVGIVMPQGHIAEPLFELSQKVPLLSLEKRHLPSAAFAVYCDAV